MIDFAQLKKDIPIENAITFLGLAMKSETNQLRGHCPCSEGGGDRNLVVTPSKGVYYCFTDKKGGDMIALASHVKQISIKEAGEWLAKQVVQPESTVPEKKKGDSPKGFNPLEYAKTLDTKHELIGKLGLTEEFCIAMSMGVATTGVHRGRFTFPMRDEQGGILFFASDTDFKVPKHWGSHER